MDNKFIVVVVSYNNEQWIESCFSSIHAQDYTNYQIVFFDNLSTDKTMDIIQPYTKDPKFVSYHWNEKIYKTGFFHKLESIIDINDNDIIVFLDGDDTFHCENVLSYLNAVYNETNCWMTYGGMTVWTGGDNFVAPYPQNSEIPYEVKQNKLYRKDIWRTSHLKSVRGFLWKKLNKEDLRPTGKFTICTDDLIIMFGMLELCPPDKIYRLTEDVYRFNGSPDNNVRRDTIHKDVQPNTPEITHIEHLIRSKTPYNTLPIVCPTLAGGVGNQMFEVAAAASMATDNNAVLVINPNEHILPNQGRNVNTYTTNIFSRIVLDTNPQLQSQITIDECFYKPIAFQPNVKLRGHFQSYKYFDHNKKYIQDLFAPTTKDLAYISAKYPSTMNITAIQVRRGDYIKFPDHHPLLTPEYYAKAVKMSDCEGVWVFSDDIEWCKQNLHFDVPVEYIKDEDYIELYLMGYCKNIVISNSSFGWWSSYLSNGSNIYVPPIWFGKTLIDSGFIYDDLILPKWNIVK